MNSQKLIAALSTQFLVVFYNGHAEKEVSKFSDRKTAEKRVSKLIEELDLEEQFVEFFKRHRKADQCPCCGAVENQEATGEDTNQCKECNAHYNVDSGAIIKLKGKKKSTKLKAPKEHKEPRSNSEGIAASWLRPDVREKRTTRHGVKVSRADEMDIVIEGQGKFQQEFRSVREAFEKLELDLGKHIGFRMKLKAAKKLEGFGYNWEIL